MNPYIARKIADGLTWTRIWSALPITVLAWYEQTWWVLVLYVIAALTDLFDGWFGRRATPPEKDIDFDGAADVFFSIMTLVWIWMLVPEFFQKYWLPYIPILAIIQAYLSAARWRWPGIMIPHFQFGRFGMALYCFLLPVLITFGDQTGFVHAVFIIGTVGKLQLAWHVATCAKPARCPSE